MKKRIIALILAVLMTTALCACGGGKTEEAKAILNELAGMLPGDEEVKEMLKNL